MSPIFCSDGAKQVNGVASRCERATRDADVLERESRDRNVNCEVEVISWRERRIKAEISVNADVESVWNALTDYERLADFIPNLVSRFGISVLFCC